MKYALTFFFLVVVLAVHAFFISRDIYNKVWWSDIVLHAAGGVWAAMLVRVMRVSGDMMRASFLVLVLGVGWEVLEFFLNIPFFGVGEASFSNSLWVLDTISDLLVDVLAALTFLIVFPPRKMLQKDV